MNKIWILIGVIVVLAVMGYGGYRVMHHFARTAAPAQTAVAPTTKTQVSPTVAAMQNSVYKMMAKGKLGNVMTDTKGMTLYTYAKDTSGASSCTGQCLKLWPAYVATSETGNFPTNIRVIKNADGTLQYAWNAQPL